MPRARYQRGLGHHLSCHATAPIEGGPAILLVTGHGGVHAFDRRSFATFKEALDGVRAFLAEGKLPRLYADAHPSRRVTVAKRVLKRDQQTDGHDLGNITVSRFPWLMDVTLVVRGTGLTALGDLAARPLFLGLMQDGPTLTFTTVQPWSWFPMTSFSGADVDRVVGTLFELIEVAEGN